MKKSKVIILIILLAIGVGVAIMLNIKSKPVETGEKNGTEGKILFLK